MPRVLLMTRAVGAVAVLILSACLSFGAWRWVANGITTEQFAQSTGLMLEEIRVTGAQHVSKNTIVDIAGCAIKRPVLSLDVWQIKRDLESKSTWIKKAAVARRFPNVLEIHVEERVPVAIWRDTDGAQFIIDEEGVSITRYVGGGRFKGLVTLEGVNANRYFADIKSIMGVNHVFAGNISTLVRVSDRRWNIITNNGIEVLLPEENYTDAWRQAVGIMEANDVSIIKKIDMRIAGKIFFTRK